MSTKDSLSPDNTSGAFSRKNFLKIAGISAAAIGVGSCELDSIPPPEPLPELSLDADPRPDDFSVYVGSGDTGIMNFVYTLTQLEAAFYTRVLNNPYDGITPEEERILGDIQQHGIAHRDFIAAFLGEENRIQDLNFEFFSTDFSDRASVLQTAIKVEDVGVSAYNVMPEILRRTNLVVLVSKIVSVEGRHAAAVRNLLQPNSTLFIGSDIISPRGLDVFNSLNNVRRILFPFIIERLDIRDVPDVRR